MKKAKSARTGNKQLATGRSPTNTPSSKSETINSSFGINKSGWLNWAWLEGTTHKNSQAWGLILSAIPKLLNQPKFWPLLYNYLIGFHKTFIC